MQTIKLPIQNLSKEDISFIKEIQRQQSIIIRFAYNRFVEKKTEKEIRLLVKKLNQINFLDSWLIQSAIKEAEQIYKTSSKDKSIIFGGKLNWLNYIKKKITKEEFKENRLNNIVIQGEANQFGNRKFELNIEDNSILFKINRNKHIELKLPELRKNYFKLLSNLQIFAEDKEVPYLIKLNDKFIFISFEEFKKEEIVLNKNKVFGIDMNPNSTGYSVLEFNDKNEYKVINSGIIDISNLTKDLKISSDDKNQIYQNNKREFESFEICKLLVSKAKEFNCSKFVVEELEFKTKDRKLGNKFNRLVNNVWNINKFQSNLNKRCSIENIEFVKINPAYSSIIGNLENKNYPDPISASIEIGRRGYKKFEKNWFYPKLNIESLKNLWKEDLNWSLIKEWKQLFEAIKNLKLKYRVPLDLSKFKVFRNKSERSFVDLLCFV